MRYLCTFLLLACIAAMCALQGCGGGGGGKHPQTPEDRIIAAFGGDNDFLWGSATASYQVEGAWDRDGRQQSIWDDFSHVPGHTYNNETGDVADDFYDKWESDIDRIVRYKFNAFRMSISWPRIFPMGADGSHQVNPKGLRFYKGVISRLLSANVTPAVTIYHWDLPNDLDWLDDTVVQAFVTYSDFLFQSFPEVKHWITFNEPYTFCPLGYGSGIHAPGIKSEYKQYICGHNLLRAHAKVVSLYRAKYQQQSGGQIGITINYGWAFPWNASSPADTAAAQLHRDFQMGWWADPIWGNGDYPESMRTRLGAKLPNFTDAEKARLKGSSDFYGMNIYTGNYVKADTDPSSLTGFTETHIGPDGQPIGEVADSPWLYVVPRAIYEYLMYVHRRYKPQSILITENGCDVPGENSLPLESALNDTFRVNYYRSYLDEVAKAVQEAKVPVKGYFAWSLMDNYEWADGYRFRFGITYVNYTTQERYAKASAHWFTQLIQQMRTSQFRGPAGSEELTV